MRHVYTGRDAMDATFLRGLLEQEGIRAVVQGEALQEAWGDLPLSAESVPGVWVDDPDADRAAPVVDEYRRRYAARPAADDTDTAAAGEAAAAARPTWACRNCGQRLEEQFTACWHCGHERPPGPDGAVA